MIQLLLHNITLCLSCLLVYFLSPKKTLQSKERNSRSFTTRPDVVKVHKLNEQGQLGIV
ncbi:hypothetical protein EXN66_Car001986 [Channa argus]|uniref:Uncharacterized protein n=1 Tax=Channa argus TaxID=215402 RepID=A0A6G1P865_CHAAH|nr:hypothetical protein EXN66_Car001986 [Channa argus]